MQATKIDQYAAELAEADRIVAAAEAGQLTRDEALAALRNINARHN